MNRTSPRLALFAATGVELEYMIVDADTLDVRPLSDELIRSVTGAYDADVERGRFCWSNELVLHVIEFKTNGPATALPGLARGFQAEVAAAQRQLDIWGARLMPTAMHPWMDPVRETRLWPHEYSPVYQAYHRIFGCQGHGWSNLQSLHLNLPFADDREFGALHAAIRALLPILPALAASSPVLEAHPTGWLDTRLAVYRTNSARIPSITGRVIPEAIFSEVEYARHILEPMYRDVAPHDAEGVLQDEFLNARGAIARFGRGSIEIRVLDTQECPQADLAVTQLIVAVLRALVGERWQPLASLKNLALDPLETILLATIQDAEAAQIQDRRYLDTFGWDRPGACAAGDLWQHLAQNLKVASEFEPDSVQALDIILGQGTLARRLLRALGSDSSREALRYVYGQLCDCLARGQMFVG
ncbi:MAG: glutamate--cysteine ligase [Verrucomicrobia bacterium]|nr:glutamate--cysteine ligase [Verrucomicrobiota bacterium]